MGKSFRVLLLSGSTRARPASTTTLKTAGAVARGGVVTAMHEGLSALPAFNPDDDTEPPPAVAELREQLAATDAVLFCTPEYAGTLPGSLKNLLDWTADGSDLYGKPTAWINAVR